MILSAVFLSRLFLLALVSGAPATAWQESSDTYYVVFLRRDPARKPLSEAEGKRIQSAHMENILNMGERGVLVAAGPFDDDPPAISGIFVMRASSVEEAQRIAAEDPTVVEHRNAIDVHAWHGPKGIGDEYRRLHKEQPEAPGNMGIHPLCMLFTGPAWDTNPNDRARLLKAHQAYFDKLRSTGKLGAAGEVDGDKELVGIAIFKRLQSEEAQKLMEEDPAVKAGLFRVEHHRWWSVDHVLPW